VVCTALLVGGIVVLAVVAAVTYLTARGYDPQPVVQLAGTAVAALAAVGTFVQNLATRRTTTKVERHTGVLAANVGVVVEELDAARYGDHAYPPDFPESQAGLPPVPEATRPHPLYGHGAAPAPGGR
jgi:4-amino-4-deoxy-L-arabinose transferase-like glycosyltransferase